MTHSLLRQQGDTTILWNAGDRQWHVMSTDPLMVDLLRQVATQHGVLVDERDGVLRFVAPSHVPLGYEDFAPEARQRVQFGLSMPSTQDAGVIDGRQREASTPVILTVGAGGLTAESGEAK